MLSTWTLLILLVYNPGETGDPVFNWDKIEFYSKNQCYNAATTAQRDLGKRFSNVATVCVNREPVVDAPLSTWTNLTFLAYNPGRDQRRLVEKVKIEFFSKDQCERGAAAIAKAADTIPGMSRVAGACFGRQDGQTEAQVPTKESRKQP